MDHGGGILAVGRDTRDSGSSGPDSAGAGIAGLATNLKATPSKPAHLTVELLDVGGQIVATLTQDLPALSPRQSQAFDLKASGRGIAGWRYRAS